jgi:hypothetical protein
VDTATATQETAKEAAQEEVEQAPKKRRGRRPRSELEAAAENMGNGKARATDQAGAAEGEEGGEEAAMDVDEAQELTCATCKSGADEDNLLICDGCEKAQHTYCARPVLDEVPSGDWFCATCTLKAQVIEQAGGELRFNGAMVAELRKPTHGVSALWRFKVPLVRSCCQLLLHLRELVEAIDRAKLKPLIEEFAELNRSEMRARRESDAQELSRRKNEQKEQREISAVMEALLKQVEKLSKRNAKEEARDAKERAKHEAMEEKKAAREERATMKTEAEVQRCLDRLIAKVRPQPTPPARTVFHPRQSSRTVHTLPPLGRSKRSVDAKRSKATRSCFACAASHTIQISP